MPTTFRFLDPGAPHDGELELALTDTAAADPSRNRVPVYFFDILSLQTREKMGNISLRVGYNESIRYCGHIGYGVYPNYRGHHYAARACRLLFPLARAHGMDKLLITCRPDNIASYRTCEWLGARFLGIVDLPETDDLYKAGARQECVFEIGL